MTQRYQRTTVRLLLALGGRSPMRASKAGPPAGGPHLQPDQRPGERGVGNPLSFEQLAAIHGGIGGIREKVHLPLYDAC